MIGKKATGCVIGIMLLGGVFALSVQGEEAVQEAANMSEQMPKAEAEAVWKYISEENPFKKWTFWEDHQRIDNGNGAFSPNHKVYVNQQTVDSKSTPFQNESMAVSYIRSPADELQAIVVMYKVKGYNPSAGDWFWARYSLTGEVEDAGKIERCIKCHARKAADNDYIITHKLEE